jgi:hypothetical protein
MREWFPQSFPDIRFAWNVHFDPWKVFKIILLSFEILKNVISTPVGLIKPKIQNTAAYGKEVLSLRQVLSRILGLMGQANGKNWLFLL